MNDVTIVVNSCDKYEDAWEPFFKLLKIYWPECENYKIILNTESKVYDCDFLNVTTIRGGRTATWSQRLKHVLKQIDSDFVCCFLEDYFLKQRVSNEMFEEAVDLMRNDKKVGYIGLKYSDKRTMRDGSQVPDERFISRDLLNVNMRASFMSVLWRREWLIKLLREHETAWDFEIYASKRSKRYSYKMLDINNSNNICPCVFDFNMSIKYGYGITQGQWLPKNKDLFEKHGIFVNFDNLGINYDLYNAAINTKEQKEKIEAAKKVTEKLPFKERLFLLVKSIRKLKKTIKKKIRVLKSLI